MQQRVPSHLMLFISRQNVLINHRVAASCVNSCGSFLSWLIVVAAIIFANCTLCVAQTAAVMNVELKLVPHERARVSINGKTSVPMRRWRFIDSYAGVGKLDGRIENLQFYTTAGEAVSVRKIAAGEFETLGDATSFTYDLRLSPPFVATDAAHVSWLDDEHGLLMLGDLLPQNSGATHVKFLLPDDWNIASVEFENASQSDFTARNGGEVEAAVFAIGKRLRSSYQTTAAGKLLCIVDGEWAFSDRELTESVEKILDEHRRVAGNLPHERIAVTLVPFAQSVASQRWSAETRGATVSLLMGKIPARAAARSQLEIILAHELFHLWIPNGLNLDGDYAWFYEGFTLYQALRVAVKTGTLSFDDYLKALANAIDKYEAAERQGANFSLVEASQNRWRAANNRTIVYSKAMVVASLYDLQVREQSKGKRSLDDVYKELVRAHHLKQPRADAKQAILNVLNKIYGSPAFTNRYVNEKDFAARAEFARAGLRMSLENGRTRLAVNDSLSDKQRKLIKQLGG